MSASRTSAAPPRAAASSAAVARPLVVGRPSSAGGSTPAAAAAVMTVDGELEDTGGQVSDQGHGTDRCGDQRVVVALFDQDQHPFDDFGDLIRGSLPKGHPGLAAPVRHGRGVGQGCGAGLKVGRGGSEGR